MKQQGRSGGIGVGEVVGEGETRGATWVEATTMVTPAPPLSIGGSGGII